MVKFNKSRWMAIWMAAAVGTIAVPPIIVQAAVANAEDLAGCTLPNGVLVIPAADMAQASNSTLIKITAHAPVPYPEADDGKVLTRDQVVAKLRASKAADLAYIADQGGGGLWAFSGCITNVPGASYLSSASGKALDAPLQIPRTTLNSAGLYSGIEEGRLYLLQTTDKKYALLRVLEKTKTAVVIQFVYQPDASLTFNIPMHEMVAYVTPTEASAETPATGDASPVPSPLATRATQTTQLGMGSASPRPPEASRMGIAAAPVDTSFGRPPAAIIPGLPAASKPALGPDDYIAPGYIVLSSGSQSTPANLESSMDAYSRQRTQMIQRRLEIIRGSANSNLELDTKAQAIQDLPALHADEAADVLVGQIAFLYTHSQSKEFSPDALHPSVAALKRLGKAGVDASIKGLKTLDITRGEGIESDRYKADLMSMVIVAVEGKDVAQFLFHRELDHASDARARAVFTYLLSKTEPQQ